MVVASDPDAGQARSFAIVSGNTNGAFAINASTGKMTVANSAALDYEATTSFPLVIRVTNNGNPNLSSIATVTSHIWKDADRRSMLGTKFQCCRIERRPFPL